jgi:hypothetical protein
VDPRDFVLTTPLHVLLGEPVDVARFCEQHWEPLQAPPNELLVRPGLKDAGPDHLERAIVEEILVLQQLVQRAQTEYLLAITPPNDAFDLRQTPVEGRTSRSNAVEPRRTSVKVERLARRPSRARPG